jgi:hypothetical protein
MLRRRRQVALEGNVGDGPAWPRFGDGEAPRVLIEHPDPAAARFLADAFRRRGFDTLTCGGPAARGAGSVVCPLLTEGACPAVDGADVVVSSLQVNQGDEGRVVRGIVADPTAPPVLLEATTWQISQTDLSDGVVDRCFPFTSAHRVVDRAVDLLVVF